MPRCGGRGGGDVRLAEEHRQSRGRRRSIGGLRRSGRHDGRGTRDAGGVRCGGRRLRDRVLPRPRLHLVLFAIADRDDPELRRAVLRWAPGAFLGPSLLVGASFFDGSADLALWAAALAVDYLSPQVGHGRGWRLPPAHFVERHGLIMIVALGESIVTIGVGAAGCLSMPPGSRPRNSIWSSPRRSGGCTSTASSTSRRPSSPTPQVRRGRRSRATCTRTSTWPFAYGTGGRDRGGPR